MHLESEQDTFPSTSGFRVEPMMVCHLQAMPLWEARLSKLPFPAQIAVTPEEVRQASQQSDQIVTIH